MNPPTTPVFVDDTGRRRTIARRAGRLVVLGFIGYLALLAAGFARDPRLGPLALPTFGLPGLVQSEPAPAVLGDVALQTVTEGGDGSGPATSTRTGTTERNNSRPSETTTSGRPGGTAGTTTTSTISSPAGQAGPGFTTTSTLPATTTTTPKGRSTPPETTTTTVPTTTTSTPTSTTTGPGQGQGSGTASPKGPDGAGPPGQQRKTTAGTIG